MSGHNLARIVDRHIRWLPSGMGVHEMPTAA